MNEAYIDVGFWPTVPGPPPSALEREYLPDKSKLMDLDIADAEVSRNTALAEAHDPSWRQDNPAEYAKVLDYLSNPERTEGYRGFAHCRVCGCVKFAEEQAVQAVPKRQRQRQDALEYQLQSLLSMATRAGCYDAADWLKEKMKPCPKP